MLEVLSRTTSTTVGEAPAARPSADINGRKLSRRLKQISVSHRALMAHDVETGGLILHHLTRKQSTTLLGVSPGYVTTAANLTSEEREQVEASKLSLSAIHNRKREPSAAFFDRLVRHYPDAVLQAVDRYTRPQFAFAAE